MTTDMTGGPDRTSRNPADTTGRGTGLPAPTKRVTTDYETVREGLKHASYAAEEHSQRHGVCSALSGGIMDGYVAAAFAALNRIEAENERLRSLAEFCEAHECTVASASPTQEPERCPRCESPWRERRGALTVGYHQYIQCPDPWHGEAG